MPGADQDLLGKIDALLQQSESLADPAARTLIEETIRALMDLHGQALTAMMEKMSDQPGGLAMIDVLAAEPVVSSLLLVHNLHPQPLETRVQAALDSVSPYLKSHGGSVQLLGITDEGVVHLQMQGSCHGCPSSARTLKDSIEKAILEKAPDVVSIQVEGLEPEPASPAAAPPANFLPLDQLTTHRIRLPITAATPTLTGAAV